MDIACATAEILASFIECLLIPGAMVAACGPRYGRRKTLCLWLLTACIYTLYVAFMNSWRSFSFLTPIGGMLLSIAAGKFLSAGSLKMRSLSCILAMFVIQSVDYLTFIGMGLLQGDPREIFYTSLLPGAARIGYLAVDKGCDIILFRLFYRRLNMLHALQGRTAAGLLAFTVLSYGTMQFLFAMVLNGNYVQLQGAMLVSFVILPCFLFLLIFSRITAAFSEKEKAAHQRLSAMNRLMEANYSLLNQSLANHAKAMHDFHHHLAVIDSLAQREKPAQISEYVHSIMDTSFLSAPLCRCGNDIIDAVINTKLREAEQKEITLDFRIILKDLSAFEQADICAILSNQIENAFEACETVPPEKRVQIDIRQRENFVLFKVTNPVASDPFLHNASLTSTKTGDGAVHGLGLRNMQDIAEKYSGSLKNEYVDGRFISTVLISGREC